MNRAAILLSICLGLSTPVSAGGKAVVVVPVADLRSDQTLPSPYKSDDKQQTQLLYGETVEVVTTSGAWVSVNAVQQPEFTTHNKWEGYPGWVLKSALKIGHSKAFGQPKPHPKELRESILKTAKEYMGTPYVWGGLSHKDSSTGLRGIDCSGLTHIAYRVNGVTIPRDSMDQSLKVERIQRKDLKPADLVFSAKADNPQKITHVVLYAGGDMIIEAPQTGMVVRQATFKEKFGTDLANVESGNVVGDRVVYFGRFLKD